MTTYRTIQGDAFDSVAWKLWGDEHMARHLMEANPEHADVVVFGPGVELVIPDGVMKTTVEDLPPWFNA